MPDATKTDAAPNADQAPDALMIPESMKKGATQLDRLDSICSYAEPILGGDRAKGVTAHVRRQPGKKMFVTLDPNDTLRFPVTSGLSGPRYHWKPQPNGVEYGYLTDAAKAEKKEGAGG